MKVTWPRSHIRYNLANNIYPSTRLILSYPATKTMLSMLQSIIIFMLILFVYMQVQYQYKVNNETTIYEIEIVPKVKFETVCDARAPFLFYFLETDAVIQYMNSCDYSALSKVPIHVRQCLTPHVPLKAVTFRTGMELIAAEQPRIMSEHNLALLKAIKVVPFLKKKDGYLRPPLCQFVEYDMLFGSRGGHTPLRYEINQRTFFLVTAGQITVKLAPPSATDHFDPREEVVVDNVNMEYWSPANVWGNHRRRSNVACIDVIVPRGKTLYVPPFWWYSLQFGSDTTRVLRLSYRNVMNTGALLPYFLSHKWSMINVNRTIDQLFDGEEDRDKVAVVTAKKRRNGRRATFATPLETIAAPNVVNPFETGTAQQQPQQQPATDDLPIHEQFQRLAAVNVPVPVAAVSQQPEIAAPIPQPEIVEMSPPPPQVGGAFADIN